VPGHIHEELLNWARWAWIGPLPHPLPPVRCGSAERYYRIPAGSVLEDSEPPEPKPAPPNERNARRVQAVWEGLPDYPRLALKAEYLVRPALGSARDKARYLRISAHQYESYLAVAVGKVAQEFGDAVRA
jgi:hypothetical protein